MGVGGQGPDWRTQGPCLVIFSQLPDPTLLPRPPRHSVPSAGCSEPSALPDGGAGGWGGGLGGGSQGLVPPRGPGQLGREARAGVEQSITQCWTVGRNVGRKGRSRWEHHSSSPQGLVFSWQKDPSPPPPFQVPLTQQTQETQRWGPALIGRLPKAHLNLVSLKLHNNPMRWDSLSHFTGEKTGSEKASSLPQVIVSRGAGI